MIRKSITVFSLIGLLLSVGAWGVSYFSVLYVPAKRSPNMGLHAGAVYGMGYGYELTPGWSIRGFIRWDTRWLPDYEYFGSSPHQYTWWLPLWIPTIIFLMLFLWLRYSPIHRRRKRKKLGLCVKCGYDLRGSKERCPECGQECETTCSTQRWQ